MINLAQPEILQIYEHTMYNILSQLHLYHFINKYIYIYIRNNTSTQSMNLNLIDNSIH